MMARLIPAPDGPISVQSVQLEGTTYQVTQRWNDRAQTWFCDVADANGTPIADGLALRADQPVGMFIRTLEGGWPGILMCQDTSAQGLDPAYEDLGERVELVYLEAAEVAAVEADA